MEQVIYKYVLPEINGISEIEMPINSSILTVGTQGNQLVMWATVNDPDGLGKQKQIRKFRSIFTGERFEIGMNRYLGTASFKHDNDIFPYIVCHVVELFD